MSQSVPIDFTPADRAKALPLDLAPVRVLSHAQTVRVVTERLRSVGMLEIAYRLADARNVSREGILGRTRYKRVAAARRELWALLYGSLAPISYPELGFLVARDHTTIMTALDLREEEVLATLAVGR